jgi:hypothetical protein
MNQTEAYDALKARCDELGLEVDLEQYRAGRHTPAYAHLQVFAPAGFAFQGSGTRSSCLFDRVGSSGIDWRAALAALEDELPLVPCETESEDL